MSADVHTGLLVPSPPPNATSPPNLIGPRDHSPPAIPINCEYINYHYDIPTAVICSMYIIFGVTYILCGYRCFKLIMFLTGFIFGSIIVYIICLQENLLPTYGNAGVALLAGTLFGLITMLIQYVGLFILGLHTGLLTGLAGLAVADHIIAVPPTSYWPSVGVLLLCGLVFAIFNLHWRKGLTILGTCMYGGAMLTGSVDYFLEKLALLVWLRDRSFFRPPKPAPCWFSWIILSIWPSAVLIGLLVQSILTGRGIYHTQRLGSRKKTRQSVQRGRTPAERAELRQKKYRYLYQVRTAHGDVISQSYVKSIQKKSEGAGAPGECSTLQSDATHLTILPDAQLAALTESEDDSQTEVHR